MITISQNKISEYEKRVDAGIKWLNKNKQGWVEKISTNTLNLESSRVCVIGQVFDGFWSAVFDEAHKNPGSLISFSQSVEMGFAEENTKGMTANYDLLTFVWNQKIRTLQKAL